MPRRRRRRKRMVLNLGAVPPRYWYGEIELLCPDIGRKTVRIPGPSAAAAVRNVTNPRSHLPFYATRCRILKRRIVGAAS